MHAFGFWNNTLYKILLFRFHVHLFLSNTPYPHECEVPKVKTYSFSQILYTMLFFKNTFRLGYQIATTMLYIIFRWVL